MMKKVLRIYKYRGDRSPCKAQRNNSNVEKVLIIKKKEEKETDAWWKKKKKISYQPSKISHAAPTI